MTKITQQDKIIDELLEGCQSPSDFWGSDGVFATLKKRIVERALESEIHHHLGYSKHDPKGNNTGNSRNGKGKKTVIIDNEQVEIEPPRDRNGTFEPQIIPKRQRYFEGFNDKIIAMYARGMSVRDIQSCLLDMYKVDVSEGLISNATAGIMDEVKAWQNRPLDEVYPIVFFDCIVVKCRQENVVESISVYLALGLNIDGHKELMGMWIAKTEGAKFWLHVLTEIKNRGVKDIFIACIDGLKGFPDAMETVFPLTDVQLCIVHMLRHSVRYVNWKDRKKVCADLRKIYTAINEQQARDALDEFSAKWDNKYPTISKSWKNNWNNIIPFLEYPGDIRKAIYTTNAIESLNRSFRKVIKTKGVFPNEESVYKIFYLCLENISKKWTMPIQCWKSAMNRFAIKYPDRMPKEVICGKDVLGALPQTPPTKTS